MALPALKKKPSGVFYVDLRKQGMGRVSLQTRDRGVAIEKRRELLTTGSVASSPTEPSRSPSDGPSMRDLFDRAERTVWAEAKSQATIRSNVKILNGLIGDEPVNAMTFSRLEKLTDQLRALDYAPATVKRKMDAVSKVLTMATKWTDDDGRPLLAHKPAMPTITVKNTRDRVLSKVEEEATFNAIETRRRAEPQRQWQRFGVLIRFLLDTGARLGEALQTGPDSLTEVQDENGETVTLVTFARYRTKSDKPRSIPLTNTVVEGLNAIAADMGIEKKTGREIFFPLKSATAWYMWSNIRDDLSEIGFDIQDVTLHTLRHTNLSRLARGGMELRRLQLWAGHSDPKITADRYVHLRPADLLNGVNILQGSNPSSSGSVTFTEATAKRAANGTPTLQ